MISRHLCLEVSLCREVYFVGEPIYLLVRLKNDYHGDLPVVPLKISTSDIAGNLGIVMRREDGVREFHPPYIESGPKTVSPAIEILPLLKPGKSWIIVVELLSYFGGEKGLISRPENRIEIGSGTYNLQGFYRWDFQSSIVIRSEVLKVAIRKLPLGDRWRKWRFGRTSRCLISRLNREDPSRLCCEVYSRSTSAWISGDLVRQVLLEGLERDPLETIGAFYIVEESQDAPPLFLYDLITYGESLADRENEVALFFLDELAARWPDSFIGEVAVQKQRFEEIALGVAQNAVRPRTVTEEKM